MIVAGIGCKRGTSVAAISAVVAAACARWGVAEARIDALATIAAKGDEAGIMAAAGLMGLPLIIVSEAEMLRVSDQTLTHSERVVALMQVPSVAETSALAAAGAGSRLLGPRTVAGMATCALAACGSSEIGAAP